MDRRKWHENMRLRLYRTTRDGAQATRGTGKMLYAVPVDSSWWQIRVGAETGPAIAEVKEETDARRIVACVNACAGVPTEALEKGESIEAAFTRGFAGGKVVGRADVEGVVRGMLSLLEQVDVVMDGAAIQGVGDILGPQYREEWARVHTAVREVLARVRGDAS